MAYMIQIHTIFFKVPVVQLIVLSAKGWGGGGGGVDMAYENQNIQ